MGLNAFFTYTVCFGLGFSWQQTMCMVFLCGLINILITVTKIRKMIILAIPESLQHAIGGGIGLSWPTWHAERRPVKFTPGDPKAAAKGGAVAATPGLANFNDKVLWVFLIGLVLAIVFTVMKVKGGMLLAIAITTVIGIPVRRDHLVQLAVHQRDLLPAAADLRRDLLRRGLPGTVL